MVDQNATPDAPTPVDPELIQKALEALPPMPPDLGSLRTAEDFRAAASVLYSRWQFLRRADITFNGRRDMYEILGYKTVITNQDYRDRYERGGLAGKIVDVLPDAAWRGSMEVREDKDESKDTPFEKEWKAFDERLQVQAKLLRVNKLSRLSNYACLLIGDGKPLDADLSNGNGTTDSIIYLRPLSGGGGPTTGRPVGVSRAVATSNDAQCSIKTLQRDSTNPRFGLPEFYQLNGSDMDVSNVGVAVHWSRIVHVAEGCLEDDIYGQPALDRVWNLFDDLLKVTGGGAEAFWLRANAGLQLDVDKEMTLPTPKAGEKSELQKLKDQAEEYAHQMTRMMQTRGVNIKQLGSDVANFAAPADAIITQIAGSKGIPKRILTGSEMGELASSQDRENWKDVVNGYQTQQLGPYLVRQLADRLIAYNYLPKPAGGPNVYTVFWPHIQTLTEQERADGAAKWAGVNSTFGVTVFTEAEIRDHWYGMAEADEEVTDSWRAALAEKMAMTNKTQGITVFTDDEIRMTCYGWAPLPPDQKVPIGAPEKISVDKPPTEPGAEPITAPVVTTAAEWKTLRALEAAIESGDTATIDEIIGVSR